MAITILDLTEIYKTGLPLLGGCCRCGACVSAYNAYPSKSGYLKCGDCLGSDGFETVEQANQEIFEDDDGQ